MKLHRTAFMIIVACLCLSCSKKTPAYPRAGLNIENGRGTYGFYLMEDVSGGVEVAALIHNVEFTKKGYSASIEWDAEFGSSKDEYEFTITVDGVIHRKVVSFTGTPIALMENPFEISLENIQQ